MRDADWSRETLLRSDWLIPIVAPITTDDLYTAVQNNKAYFNIIKGNFNAIVGGGDGECIGAFGHSDRKDRGEELVNFAIAHGF